MRKLRPVLKVNRAGVGLNRLHRTDENEVDVDELKIDDSVGLKTEVTIDQVGPKGLELAGATRFGVVEVAKPVLLTAGVLGANEFEGVGLEKRFEDVWEKVLGQANRLQHAAGELNIIPVEDGAAA